MGQGLGRQQINIPSLQGRDGSVGNVLVGAEAAEGDLLPKLTDLDHVLEDLLSPLACRF